MDATRGQKSVNAAKISSVFAVVDWCKCEAGANQRQLPLWDKFEDRKARTELPTVRKVCDWANGWRPYLYHCLLRFLYDMRHPVLQVRAAHVHG